MSAEHMITGFFGKIPATGDFVSRNLPADFVRVWDRWVARHLAPLLSADVWAHHIALRFLLGARANGPMAGIMLPSADRVGRRFPLTIGAPVTTTATGLVEAAAPWFAAIETAAQAAQRGEINADELASALAELTFPTADAEGELIAGMVFWTDPSDLIEVDPEAPLAAIEHLLNASWETS